jgi:hypothetical protein
VFYSTQLGGQRGVNATRGQALSDMFNGEQVAITTCAHCNHSSERVESFSDLILQVCYSLTSLPHEILDQFIHVITFAIVHVKFVCPPDV